MKKVWLHLKGREKPVLLELDRVNLASLDTKGTIIHGTRTNLEGKKTVMGFNTDNIISYDYQDNEIEGIEYQKMEE